MAIFSSKGFNLVLKLTVLAQLNLFIKLYVNVKTLLKFLKGIVF